MQVPKTHHRRTAIHETLHQLGNAFAYGYAWQLLGVPIRS